jgi:hypothetical protein
VLLLQRLYGKITVGVLNFYGSKGILFPEQQMKFLFVFYGKEQNDKL